MDRFFLGTRVLRQAATNPNDTEVEFLGLGVVGEQAIQFLDLITIQLTVQLKENQLT